MEGRNVRASYGTSKYCSAFIKTMRCNNPECTYLHSMGDIEDTFTKQEIQAGYVTSGRDVLARQQQIMQQALASQATGSTPRRKTGGGGPSGTGRASSSPIFPPPSFDEPSRASTANLVPPPVSVASQPRSASIATTTATGFPAISVAAASGASLPATAGSLHRAASTGAVPGNSATAPVAAQRGIAAAGPSAGRKSVVASTTSGTTAASVVAGVRSSTGNAAEPPASHTTLTALTPLKRNKGSSKSGAASVPPTSANGGEAPKLSNMRTGAPKNKANGIKAGVQAVASSNSSDAGSTSSKNTLPSRVESVASIGGDVIPTPAPVAPVPIGAPLGNPIAPINGMTQLPPGGSSALAGLGGLGGEVFDGPLQSNSSKSAIGTGKDKWNTPAPGFPSGNSSHLWGDNGGNNLASGVDGDVIGGGFIGGSTIGGMHGSGSSALASMLGINLPTGSGSLRESTSLWSGPAPGSQPPIASLNGNSLPSQGVIGGNSGAGGNHSAGLIGGVAIGGNRLPSSNAFGGGNVGNTSDIALLQSLLPGVHITSGGAGGGFGSVGPANGDNGSDSQQQFNLAGQPIGSNQQQRQAPGSIW